MKFWLFNRKPKSPKSIMTYWAALDITVTTTDGETYSYTDVVAWEIRLPYTKLELKDGSFTIIINGKRVEAGPRKIVSVVETKSN